MKHAHQLLPLVTLLAAPAAFAQSNISATDKYSWSENCGWMNWADAGSPAGTQAASVGAFILAGFVWCENVGWINLGDGSPANGFQYANATGEDSGVNLDPVTGHLSGLAWGENVGWINFSGGALASPAQPARIALAEPRRFFGYAWGENIGWINLDDATHFVAIAASGSCDGDVNCDGAANGIDVEVQELAVGGDMADYCQPDPDYNQDGAVNGLDVEALEIVIGGGACP